MLLAILCIMLAVYYIIKQSFKKTVIPISVNYHFTRLCNYSCGFCFHTAKTSTRCTIQQAKAVMEKLSNAGMKKLNFAGGEPMLDPRFVGTLAKYCKESLGLESISIVSNGSLLRKSFLQKYAKYIDIIAISCDSFDPKTNAKIGRGDGKTDHLAKIVQIKGWCKEFDIKFKLNTVVNRFNYMEDMNEMITLLDPFRWKCFQVLVLETENNGQNTIRNATDFEITAEEYQSFIDRHSQQSSMVKEDNNSMRNSYLILDENLCFLNCQVGIGKVPSQSLLDVDVQVALEQAEWDQDAFFERGGVYDWKKSTCSTSPDLDW